MLIGADFVTTPFPEAGAAQVELAKTAKSNCEPGWKLQSVLTSNRIPICLLFAFEPSFNVPGSPVATG